MADCAHPARYDRLYDALKVLLVQESFTLPEMKERLPSEIPGYVTQLVHQLEREGRLRDTDGVYSWTCELSDFPAQSWVQSQVYGTQLEWTPEEDRPRERLLARGAASMRTAELLAVLTRLHQAQRGIHNMIKSQGCIWLTDTYSACPSCPSCPETSPVSANSEHQVA